MLETALSGLVNAMAWNVLVRFSPNLHQWCIIRQRLSLYRRRHTVQCGKPNCQQFWKPSSSFYVTAASKSHSLDFLNAKLKVCIE